MILVIHQVPICIPHIHIATIVSILFSLSCHVWNIFMQVILHRLQCVLNSTCYSPGQPHSPYDTHDKNGPGRGMTIDSQMFWVCLINVTGRGSLSPWTSLGVMGSLLHGSSLFLAMMHPNLSELGLQLDWVALETVLLSLTWFFFFLIDCYISLAWLGG